MERDERYPAFEELYPIYQTFSELLSEPFSTRERDTMSLWHKHDSISDSNDPKKAIARLLKIGRTCRGNLSPLMLTRRLTLQHT